ncbi:MAG TPA: hypothetical protein PK129_05650 [Cellvibrionaceae bacterium]|nr:hypothetical protein [Cellvibrionaceae bacterium]
MLVERYLVGVDVTALTIASFNAADENNCWALLFKGVFLLSALMGHFSDRLALSTFFAAEFSVTNI